MKSWIYVLSDEGEFLKLSEQIDKSFVQISSQKI